MLARTANIPFLHEEWFLVPTHKASFGSVERMWLRYFLPVGLIWASLVLFCALNHRFALLLALRLWHLHFIAALFNLDAVLFYVYLYGSTRV